MCSYNDYRHAPMMMAMNANCHSSHSSNNWFSGSSYCSNDYAFYPNNASSLVHDQPRSTISFVRENMRHNSDASMLPWSNNNYNTYKNHENQKSSYHAVAMPQYFMAEYSNDDSDVSSNPHVPELNLGVFDWMKKNDAKKSMAVSEPQPDRTRTKDKYRIVYTDQQKLELEKEFYCDRYISGSRRQRLADGLGLSQRQIKIWFQNRRAKDRKLFKRTNEEDEDDYE